MGAWGLSAFENDDAGDWVWKLEEAENESILKETLDELLQEGGLEDAPTCSEALAAAEVVAALAGAPHPDLPQSAAKWIAGHPAPDGELIALASAAVSAVMAGSELWEESDEYAAWKSENEQLLKRLASGS